MRVVFGLLVGLVILPVIGEAASEKIKLTSPEQSLGWIKGYRERPHPEAVPNLVKELAAVGAFLDPEAAGVYVGFMAGVIGKNPDKARKLVAEMAKIPAADQWAVVKAIAYSRLGGWRHLMEISAIHLPSRQVMIDAYLTGKLPGYDRYRIEAESPSMWQRAGRLIGVGGEKEQAHLEPSPVLLDTFWGYYFATGSNEPIADIANLVHWSKDGNNIAHLTIGSAAKYSLAANASRDAAVLASVRTVRNHANGDLIAMLDEAIFAAEISETGKLRDDAAEAIATLRQKGPAYLRNVAWWGRAGEGAIALGCIAAAATGQAYLGVPCVIGGAVSSAALRYLARQS